MKFILLFMLVLVSSFASAQLANSENSDFQTLTPGGTTEFTFPKANTPISSVVVTSPQDAAANRGKLLVGETFVSNFKKSYFSNQDLEVEYYLVISPSSIASRNVESVTVYFSLQETTLTNPTLYVETSSGWDEIATSFDGASYSATIPGFDTLAIADSATVASAPEPAPVEPQPAPEPDLPPSPPVDEPAIEPIAQPEPTAEPIPEPISDTESTSDDYSANQDARSPLIWVILGVIIVASILVVIKTRRKTTTAKRHKK